MTDSSNTPIIYTESPASWNTRYIDPSGFECQLTLRAANGSELLAKAAKALEALVDLGCTPVAQKSTNGHANGKPQEAPKMDNGQPDPAWCSIHGIAMKRHEKDSQVWYSHRLDDNTYCKGKK